jgi:hypothetical protein
MGFLDSITGSSDNSAQEYLKQALAAYNNVNVPTTASETVNELPMQSVQGTVTPQNIQVAEQAPSEYNNISLDPATRAAQMSALQSYTDIANSGGLDAESKLAIQQAIDAANAQSRGAQGAIMNQAQAMGQGGGDFALTQRAIAAQGASNTAATQGMQAAAEAEANREAALNSMANIGGSINASDYGQAANKAASQNTINATNTGARNAANTGNVSNQIQTGEFNTNTAQGVNAANTTAGQNKVYYNASLPQQQFNNELAKASGVAGVDATRANAAQAATNANNAFTGSLLGTAGTVAGAALGGPAGAVIGNQVAKTAAPKSNNASAGINAAHGGYMCYADGGVAHDHGICMKLGGHVGGEASVPGDSETNDTIPAMLSPGELVIPRSVPKDGKHMEEFARNAPVHGTDKKVDLTGFTSGYKRSR